MRRWRAGPRGQQQREQRGQGLCPYVPDGGADGCASADREAPGIDHGEADGGAPPGHGKFDAYQCRQQQERGLDRVEWRPIGQDTPPRPPPPIRSRPPS